MKVIVYDCEIAKAIPSDKFPLDADIQTCKGWRDFENMGCSMITTFDYNTWMPSIFMADNIIGFFEQVESADVLVGFNNHNFDDNLLAHLGVRVRRWAASGDADQNPLGGTMTFDLLRAIWSAAGLDPNSFGYHHQGYGLDDMALANLGHGKVGESALAAVLYQRGKWGQFTHYGLRDIMLTAYLLYLAKRQPLINPKKPEERLHVHIPFDVLSIPLLV